MTFEEALVFKKYIGETIVNNELIMTVFVTPQNEKDFIAYRKDYREHRFDDNSASLYSNNGRFKVCGLWTDGKVVFHKELFS